MSDTLQPSDSERATLLAIAWQIVQRYLPTTDAQFTAEETGSLVFHTVMRMTEQPDDSMKDDAPQGK